MTYSKGQTLTADDLNASFASKTDNANANITGGTITGLQSLNVAGTAATTSPTTGAVTVAGGVGVVGDVQVGGKAVVGSTTDSTSTTTGAVVVAGGVGIAKSVSVGGAVAVGSTTDSTTTTTGAVTVAGGVGIAKSVSIGGAVAIGSTTQSTSSTTGATTVAGGLGVAKNVNVGGALGVTGAATVGGLATVGNLTLAAAGVITFADGTTQSTSGTTGVLLKANNLSDVTSTSSARSNIGAAKSGANSDITSLTGLTTALSIAQGGTGGAPLSGKNVIINGACGVQQRGTSLVVTNGAQGYGGPDRFTAGMIGSGQFTQSAGTMTYNGVSLNAVVQTVNTAKASFTSTDQWTGIQTRIEGFNCRHLLGQAAALQFKFNTNVSGTYSVAIADGAAGNSYVTTFAATANVPVLVSIPIASLPTSLSVPFSNGVGLYLSIGGLTASPTSTLNAWQSGNFGSASGFTNWAATVGNFISLTELQLEPGSASTAFERRPFTTEVALCQRYYQTLANAIVSGYGNATNGIYTTISLPTLMRAPPTFNNGSVTTSNCSGYGANSTYTSTIFLQAAVTATGPAFAYANVQLTAEL